MLFSPTMEYRRTKNLELNKILPKNMYITKKSTYFCIEHKIYAFNNKTGDFLDKLLHIVIKDNESIDETIQKLTIRSAEYINKNFNSPEIVLGKPDDSTWLKKTLNPRVHKKICKGISIERKFGGIMIRINTIQVAKNSGKIKNILCKNVYSLESCIDSAIEIIKSVGTTSISKSILLEDRIYFREARNIPLISCGISQRIANNKLLRFDIAKSLNKYSVDEALKQVREFRDMKIKELNLRPARPLTELDILNIEKLKSKYDNLKPEQP